MEREGLAILQNVKTQWIALLEPLKRVMGEYKTLIVKMWEDAIVQQPKMTSKQAPARESARHNYDLLCDINTLLTLPCIMPPLKSVNSLMNILQSNHVFVSDYVKIYQRELYMIYNDPDTTFQRQNFQMFSDVVDDHSYAIS